MRKDWHLPPNATALFGMGYGLVAAAKTAPPGAGSSASPGASAGNSSSPSASTSPSPTATPTPVLNSNAGTTWWWSATGVSWQQSGLVSSGGNWTIANNEVLVFDAPTRADGNWTPWISADGKSWSKPSTTSVVLPGSRTCAIATRGDNIVIVSWQSAGVLKGYYGVFASK
jgi:hypothetical protein